MQTKIWVNIAAYCKPKYLYLAICSIALSIISGCKCNASKNYTSPSDSALNQEVKLEEGKTSAHNTTDSRFNVYYLAIGSEHYKNNVKLDRSAHYDNVPEAATSALSAAMLLETYAGAKGNIFLSKQNNMFSKAVIQTELQKIWDRMLKEQPENPLLVIYYSGHGISENLLESQFLLSGDCSKMKKEETFDNVCKQNVFVPEIVQMITELSFKSAFTLATPTYMILLDCCRGTKQNDSLNMDKVGKNWGADTSIIKTKFDETTKATAQFLAGLAKRADPIIYSISTLQDVPVADIPTTTIPNIKNPPTLQIGPLCRRMLMLVDQMKNEKEKSIDIEGFIKRLLDKELDSETPIPMTYTRRIREDAQFLHIN